MDITSFLFQGNATLKGFIRNGLDSSTLINLIVVFDGKFEIFRKHGFTFPPHLFFYHELSRPEVIGVLINKHKFTKEEAIEAFDNLVKDFYLEKIQRITSKDQAYQKVVEDANKVIVKKLGEKFHIGDNDILIIAGFLRENVTFVHSGDKGFIETCEELRMNAISLPQGDRDKESEIKQWMKKRKS